ncbi:hypothetical protein [Alkaliphilus serpentinus]|uniref:Nitrogen regulatory protein P-II family n=1 Tax=Alkaliphilus serpentinus TaxID=1482731 RepID=A0A833HNY8_9FIRM|nr:hypothetical protein [Alkaliphilus serpentinus]KAB3530068.1 hypothetical protein F8153_08240 [Alkaliphilus serpentinus]
MHALFIVLNRTEYLDDILTEFVTIGIKGATILDSQGMASALVNRSEKSPIFDSLRSFLYSSRPFNKTIFTIIEDEELLEQAMDAVDKLVGDFNKKGVGIMFSIPIGKVRGLKENPNNII